MLCCPNEAHKTCTNDHESQILEQAESQGISLGGAAAILHPQTLLEGRVSTVKTKEIGVVNC